MCAKISLQHWEKYTTETVDSLSKHCTLPHTIQKQLKVLSKGAGIFNGLLQIPIIQT
jgi:hypothetical protein